VVGSVVDFYRSLARSLARQPHSAGHRELPRATGGLLRATLDAYLGYTRDSQAYILTLTPRLREASSSLVAVVFSSFLRSLAGLAA